MGPIPGGGPPDAIFSLDILFELNQYYQPEMLICVMVK